MSSPSIIAVDSTVASIQDLTVSIFKLLWNYFKVLEVMGCHSSVARALVAKARGPGFDSPATTKIFFTFCLCFSLDPFK